MNCFLKAKHWQLFLMILGLPIICRTIIFAFYNFSSEELVVLPLPFLVLNTIVNIISILFFFSWLWSVGIILQNNIPPSLKLNVRYFKIALLIAFIICVSSVIWFQTTFRAYSFNIDFIGFALITLFAYTILLFIILLIPSGYCIFFVAKTIKTLELQKEVKRSELIAEIILIVLFPIGIWFVQPLINLINEEIV